MEEGIVLTSSSRRTERVHVGGKTPWQEQKAGQPHWVYAQEAGWEQEVEWVCITSKPAPSDARLQQASLEAPRAS